MLRKGNHRDILIISIGPLGSALFSILLVFMVSWNFPPEVLGVLALLELIAVVFVMVFTLGFDQAYVREYAAAADKSVLFATAARTPIASALIVVGVAVGVLPMLGINILDAAGQSGTFVALAYGLAALVIRMLSVTLRMGGSPATFAGLQVAQRAATVAILAFCLVVTTDRTLTGAMLCYLMGSALSAALHLLACRGHVRYALSHRSDTQLFRQMLRYGVPAAVAAFLYALLSSSDRLSLAIFGNERDLGIYAVALSIAGAVNIFTAVFSVIWAPFVYQNEEQARDATAIALYLDIVTLLTLLAGAAISTIAWFLPIMFPADYAGVAQLVPACMALPLFYILSEAFGVGIGVSRRMGFATVASAISAAVALGVSFLSVPTLHVAGAALGIAAGALSFLVARTELGAALWYRLPTTKMYLAVSVYFLGCIGALLWGSQLGLFFPVYWAGFGMFCVLLFYDRLRTIVSLARHARLGKM